MSKILLIDDRKDVTDIYEGILENYIPNCVFYAADNGQKGLDIAFREFPDVILLDIIMPGIDGWEVCRQLRSSESAKHTPIIMITGGDVSFKSKLKSMDVGADLFLSKPVKAGELIAQVKMMLRIKNVEDIWKYKTSTCKGENTLQHLRELTYKMTHM